MRDYAWKSDEEIACGVSICISGSTVQYYLDNWPISSVAPMPNQESRRLAKKISKTAARRGRFALAAMIETATSATVSPIPVQRIIKKKSILPCKSPSLVTNDAHGPNRSANSLINAKSRLLNTIWVNGQEVNT